MKKTTKLYRIILLASALALCLPLAVTGCSSDKDDKETLIEEEIIQSTDEDEPQLEAELADVHDSGCTTGDTRSYNAKPVEKIILKKEGTTLSCELVNYIGNCGVECFDLNMEMAGTKGGRDSVLIDVKPVVPSGGMMDCECPYNVYFSVRGLSSDEFFLKCWWYEGIVSFKEEDTLTLENIIEDASIGGLTYRLFKTIGQAVLTSAKGCEGAFSIPPEVDYEGKAYTVTGIKHDAFNACPALSKVTIPKSVRRIDIDAYSDVNYNIFCGCTLIESIEVEKGSEWFCSVDGVLFNADRTWLYSYPAGSTNASYDVPEGVEWISANAFAFSSSLKTIRIPDTVTDIYYHAFWNCTALEQVMLPKQLEIIDLILFKGCTNLKVVIIPDKVKEIRQGAFADCAALRTLDIPESVSRIGAEAFSGCKLETLYIRGGLEKECFAYKIFGGMDTTATLYVLPSEIENFMRAYKGTVLPLP